MSSGKSAYRIGAKSSYRLHQSGYAATVGAMQAALASTGRVDEASVAVAAARAASGSIVYDEPVDLGAYDRALSLAKGA